MDLKEKELTEGIKAGNKSVFDLLFNNYYSQLCVYANGYLKSPDTSEEIVQEVFVRLWETHSNILIHTSVKAYLYRCVYNASINHLNKIRSTVFKQVEFDQAGIRLELMQMVASDSEFSKLLNEEAENDLQEAIDELPAQCREIFNMCRNENLSYPVISGKLNVSLSTVKTQMSRAMERLFIRMEKYL